MLLGEGARVPTTPPCSHCRAIERMRADEFVASLLSAHAALACLVHTSNILPTLVRLHWRTSEASDSDPLSSVGEKDEVLGSIAVAIATLASGLARAATAAAGGLDVPSLAGLLQDVAVLEGGMGSGTSHEDWRLGRRLLDANVMYFALARLHEVRRKKCDIR